MSTTKRERGQALPIFALSLVTLLLFAALAFDVGAMLLEHRTEQNAADAAAIAGARYLPANTGQARAAAFALAAENGYVDGAGTQAVDVHIPPVSGPFAGLAGYIEVEISQDQPSFFGPVLGLIPGGTGVDTWAISGRAVAVNQEGLGGGYSIIALDPDDCPAMKVSGNGEIIAYGNIQVNSSCTNNPEALQRIGNGDVTVDVENGACSVVGGINDGGGRGDLDCVPIEGAPLLPDPLLGVPAPPMPALPSAAVQVAGATLPIPDGCPGSTNPATEASPATCQFQSSYKDTTWRLFPGLYPGGIKLQGGVFYLEPGIYWIGGGGLDVTGNDTTSISVDSGGTTGPAGGVLFYNTELPGSSAGPITLNGSSAKIHLWPLDIGSLWDGLIIFQDRDVNINGDDVTINGGTSDMDVRGTIYVPLGDVKVNGSGGKMTMDQVIAGTFMVTGQTGSIIEALNDEDFIFKLIAAGLVE